MTAAKEYTFKGTDDKSILEAVLKDTAVPLLPINEYSENQLRQILPLLINAVRFFIEAASGVTGTGLQEWLDTMRFKAGKDSATSSMRPSSDMYRSHSDSRQGQPDQAVPAGQDEKPAAAATGSKAAQAAQDAPEEPAGKNPEQQSEEELRKDRDRSLRTKSGKEPGGQKGHPGAGFHIPPHIDETRNVIMLPEKCRDCPKWEACKKDAKPGIKHNEFDIEIKIVQTVYQPVDVTCPEGGTREISDYPDHAQGVNQYGVTIQTVLCLLYCVGMVSLDRIKKIVSPLLGLPVSTATIQRYVHVLSEKARSAVNAILEKEKDEHVVHCDETGARVNGTLGWIHCVSTELYTFVSFQLKRGKEGMDAIGFLSEYVGTVVHDCWSSYWGYDNCLHAVCNGHIQRELTGLSKFFHNANLWADDMVSLLQEMLHEKHMAQEKKITALSPEALELFSRRFDALINRGKELHPLPERMPGQRGRLKRGRARALIDRMEERKPEIFRFLTDFDVPYTNNTAESSFRLIGTKRSVGCFRSIESAQEFCIIWSYLSTCAKHGISYFDAIKNAFEGNSMQLLFPNVTDNPNPDEAA